MARSRWSAVVQPHGIPNPLSAAEHRRGQGQAVGRLRADVTSEEIARAQKMNQDSLDMMQQSATTATQNANLVMMTNMNALMVQPVMMAPSMPMT